MRPKVSDWLHSPATTHVGHVGHAAHAVHSHGRAVPTAVVAAVHGALAPGVWGGKPTAGSQPLQADSKHPSPNACPCWATS